MTNHPFVSTPDDGPCSSCGKRRSDSIHEVYPNDVGDLITKEERIKELDKQIKALIDEYYELVAPTEVENEEAVELVNDSDEAECLTDPLCQIGRLYLADNALSYREMINDQDEQNEEKRPL